MTSSIEDQIHNHNEICSPPPLVFIKLETTRPLVHRPVGHLYIFSLLSHND